MTIHLPEDLERFVQAKVQSGRFASEDDAISEAVRLLRLAEDRTGAKVGGETSSAEPAWQRLVKAVGTIPDAVFDRIPADGSAQLDHYIYGSPRHPNS
ncbi:MAG TPA: hypothetical protein VK395_36000 [Gemmataceae bacterium]|nr:hypothetical protein [Gemmataceae bacterium]